MIGNKNRCGVKNVDPLATLVFNFHPPMYGKPALLTFDDVYSLFGKASIIKDKIENHFNQFCIRN